MHSQLMEHYFSNTNPLSPHAVGNSLWRSQDWDQSSVYGHQNLQSWTLQSGIHLYGDLLMFVII